MKQILQELKLDYKFQFYLYDDNRARFNFDFFIKNKNLIIECDGDYWHSNPKIYKTLNSTQLKIKQRDLLKENLLKNKNIKLLRFWESEFNNIDLIKQKIISA